MCPRSNCRKQYGFLVNNPLKAEFAFMGMGTNQSEAVLERLFSTNFFFPTGMIKFLLESPSSHTPQGCMQACQFFSSDNHFSDQNVGGKADIEHF